MDFLKKNSRTKLTSCLNLMYVMGGNIPMTIIFMLILQDAVYIIFVSHLKKLSQKNISKKYQKNININH